MSPEVLNLVPGDELSSLETSLLPDLLAAGRVVIGHRFAGQFIDIGAVDRLANAATHPLFTPT
jgi:NDP-sugar pyrophosphorylase family protein